MQLSRAFILFVSVACGSQWSYALSHHAKKAEDSCSFCGLPVLKSDAKLDHKVTLSHDGKDDAYRCVMCAIADAKGMKGDLVISAPSEKKGTPVKIERKAGKWTVDPEEAVFAFAKGSHEQCQIRYRAMTSKAAFDAYASEHSGVIGDTKPITLAELVDRSK